MTLEDLGNIGEFVGAIAVVLSLVYLALQIRQNTSQLNQNSDVVRANAELDNARLAAEFNARLAEHAELAELWRLGISESETMTDAQRLRFGFMMGDLFYRLEGLFRQRQRGFLTLDSWAAWDRLLSRLLSSPLVRSWWRARQHPFSAAFMEHVEGLIRDEASAT